MAEVLARVCANPARLRRYRLLQGAEYKTQRDALTTLADEVRSRDIQVERIVRVDARPAARCSPPSGSMPTCRCSSGHSSWPASRSRPRYSNSWPKWRNAADVELIPGLAAQIPDSPLIRWLHAVDEAIPGELRVVAGDIEGDSVTSWLKTLMADAFYWSDNDLVVQTSSMYGGAPRAAGASFVLDQGGKVSHFNYFSNDRTAEAVVNALTQDTHRLPRDRAVVVGGRIVHWRARTAAWSR